MASGSVSPMRALTRGGTCRTRMSWRRPSWARSWNSSVPPARPGQPMANRLHSSRINKPSSQSDSGESRLWIGRLAGRRIEEVARQPASLRDLHWSPRGEMLGVVRSVTGPTPNGMLTATSIPGPTATLHIWDRAGGLSGPLNSQPVRRFAGWCAAGDHLAYVVPDDVLGADDPLWSFLLVPDPQARDAVLIEDGNGDCARDNSSRRFPGCASRSRTGRPHRATTYCHSGAHSARHTGRCSRGFWAAGCARATRRRSSTRAPARSPGWPSAPWKKCRSDITTRSSIAYAEAWRRYERAEAAARKADPTPEPEPKSAMEWARRLFSPRGIAVFQFHCLTKLGRHDEARARLESFRESYPPRLPSGPAKRW